MGPAPVQSGVDLGELGGEVIIEAAQHRQFRDVFLGHGDPRKVWGRARAVLAMMNASRASV